MRVRILLLCSVLIGTLTVALPSSAGTIAKTACSQVGTKKVSAGKLYTCIKVGKKKQWNTGSTCPRLKATLTIGKNHYKCVLRSHKFTWVSYIPTPKPSPRVSVTQATLRLLAPDITDSATVNDTGDMQSYVASHYFVEGSRYFFRSAIIGSEITLTYAATNQNGVAIANHEIYLRVNRAYSNSNARFTSSAGQVIGMQNGGGVDGLRIPGVTDAQGHVSFTITNIDSVGSAHYLPASTSLSALVSSGIIGQVAPMLVPDSKTTDTFTELDQISDVLNLSYFQNVNPPPQGNPSVDVAPLVNGHVVGTQLWKDDFSSAAGTSPSSSVWTSRYCGQAASNGGGTCFNSERQHYVPDANKIDGSGNLVITTTKLNSATSGNCGIAMCEFTSGRLDTQGKVSFQYGYIEARIATPLGGANWPALWMLGDNITTVQWPTSGEMDIMEGIGASPTVSTGALHYNAIDNQGHQYVAGSFNDGRTLTGEFHTYGIAWLPDSITLYVDGIAFLTESPSSLNPLAATSHPGVAEWPFSQPFFLILNNAIGTGVNGAGGFGGDYTGWSSSQMKIDWVRSYQLDGLGSVTAH